VFVGLVISIVLLNEVIALLSDSYERVQESAAGERLRGVAALCVEYMVVHMSKDDLDSLIQDTRWAHCLVPESLEAVDDQIGGDPSGDGAPHGRGGDGGGAGDDAENEWRGAVNASAAHTRTIVGGLERSLSRQLHDTQAHVSALDRKLSRALQLLETLLLASPQPVARAAGGTTVRAAAGQQQQSPRRSSSAARAVAAAGRDAAGAGEDEDGGGRASTSTALKPSSPRADGASPRPRSRERKRPERPSRRYVDTVAQSTHARRHTGSTSPHPAAAPTEVQDQEQEPSSGGRSEDAGGAPRPPS